jgi:hypothetical protein
MERSTDFALFSFTVRSFCNVECIGIGFDYGSVSISFEMCESRVPEIWIQLVNSH